MRKQDDLIELLFKIYVSHAWDEMEEYFAAAYSLLMYHGARFRDWDIVRKKTYMAISDSLTEDPGSRFYGFDPNISKSNLFHNHLKMRLEQSRTYNIICKCDDSEEAWREEVNAAPEALEEFGKICITYINFKQ